VLDSFVDALRAFALVAAAVVASAAAAFALFAKSRREKQHDERGA